MALIIGAFKIIVLLGTLITIHELGHFLVARLFKVKVLKFAIGFGPKVFTKTKNETEYTLRLIPFGGFVQMEGEEKLSEDENAFNKKPIWQRILVVLAGPMVNIIFALIIYFAIVSSQNLYQITKVKDVSPTDLAYDYGFRNGDTIKRVNDKSVVFGFEVDEEIVNSKDDNIVFTIDRAGSIYKLPVTINVSKRGYLGVGFSEDRAVLQIAENMPVIKSGIRVGDIVVAINGVTMYDTNQIVDTIRTLPDQTVKITVLRDMEMHTYEVETLSNESRFLDLNYEIVSPSAGKGIIYALHDTRWYLKANLKGYAEVFTGKAKNVEVMGVVGIAGEITKTSAISEFFYLMCAISLSLRNF